MTAALTVARKRQLLATHTREIKRLKEQIAQDFWDIGQRLIDVRTRRLWEIEYASFDDYLAHGVDIARSTAWKFIRVAAEFEREAAVELGVEKLDALVSWLAVLPAGERPADPTRAQITVADPAGLTREIPIPEASAVEVRQATALLSVRRFQPDAELVERARAFSEAVPWDGAAKVTLKRRDGRVLATFADVPVELASADLLADAFRTHLAPLAEPPVAGEVPLATGRIHLG